MHYRVQIVGSINGNQLLNPDLKYEFFDISCVETLDRDFENNIIYRTKDKFEYSIFLEHPTTQDILKAKNLIRQKMIQDLNIVINNLHQIKHQLLKPIKFR